MISSGKDSHKSIGKKTMLTFDDRLTEQLFLSQFCLIHVSENNN